MKFTGTNNSLLIIGVNKRNNLGEENKIVFKSKVIRQFQDMIEDGV